MIKKFLPKTKEARLFHLGEECVEVAKLIMKTGRFGMNSFHPSDKTKNNATLILEELADLEYAISKAKPDLVEFAGRPSRIISGGKELDADKTIADIRKSIEEKNRTFDAFHKPGRPIYEIANASPTAEEQLAKRKIKRKYPSPRRHKT